MGDSSLQKSAHAWLTHRAIGPLVLALSAVAMLLWTWGRYCHPFIDFGRELYVAWRLSAGQVLYRDIDYFNGPVSPYLNSFVFRIFGVSLLGLELVNLFWWVLLAIMAYRLYVAISDRLSAFVSLLLFITLFSFLQLNETGNDNFVTPYSHEITHALVCAFALLTLLWKYLRSDKAAIGPLIGCGILLGLIFLMKVEVTLAAAAALGVGVTLRLISDGAGPRRWLAVAFTLIVAALFPSVVVFILLRIGMPSRQALEGLLGSWKYLHDARITNNLFYRHVLGTDKLLRNVIEMLQLFAAELLLIAPPAVLALSIRHRTTSETRWVGGTVAAGYVLIVIWIFWDQANWHDSMKPLNLITVTMVVSCAIAVIRQRVTLPPRLILQMAFSVFALAMLSKIFFNIAIFHYGFALTGPAFTLLVMLLVRWLPKLIHRAGGSGWIFRGAALAALGCFCLKHLQTYETLRSRPAPTIGTGADQTGVYQSAESINLVLNFLSRQPACQTVAALPQGAMINYLARRINPTGELILFPGEVAMFGEDHILERFRQHPPDWIVYVQSNVEMFGFKGFGVDYAEDILQFFKNNYDAVPLPEAHSPQSILRLYRLDPGHRAVNQIMADLPASRPATSSPAKTAAEDAYHPR